jgi:hypothetical protein
MKRLLLSAMAALFVSAAPPPVHSVYILPMAGGLDQYLAEWLTREQVVQVVADPKAADAVLTDRIGESFEQKMTEIRPADEKKKDDSAVHPSFRSSASRGTIFLVDAKTRNVLWSDYEKPLRDLNREAGRISKKLAARFKG